jgi:hypothetical protein
MIHADVPVTVWGQAELLEERARAMGRTGQRLDRLLSEMRDLERDIDRLEVTLYVPGLSVEVRRGVQEEVDLSTDTYNQIREAAAATYSQLIHQRESCGFRSHDLVERCYPIPDVIFPPAPVEFAES